MSLPLAAARVLVVDDERGVAAQIVRRLERAGAICQSAHEGAEAREMLVAGHFDLLVSDVQMPGRSGFDLAADADQLADGPAVILLAADGEIPSAGEAISRGADAFVRKPIDLDLLVHEAGAVLELRTLRRTASAIEVAKSAAPTLVVLGEIVNAFEKADPYRASYSARTARMAVALAGPLGLDGDRLALAARVHDVGMLAVPITEQHAEGPPDRTSQHLIRVHPTLGARWIERLGADRAVVAAVAAHHERFDGTGYPGGLKGDDIPPEARVLGTAAAIAAMSGPRPWRGKHGVPAVVAELEKGSGTQFGAAEAAAAIEVLHKLPGIIG